MKQERKDLGRDVIEEIRLRIIDITSGREHVEAVRQMPPEKIEALFNAGKAKSPADLR